MIHALGGLNLELHEGDRVCLIGHNGAGKTTLLRVLAGIYPASTGKVEVVGKVFALLGNSMMMNADATGYETIRLVANLYHWPQEQMPELIRNIEEFTELGEYLSLPTRVYSAAPTHLSSRSRGEECLVASEDVDLSGNACVRRYWRSVIEPG